MAVVVSRHDSPLQHRIRPDLAGTVIPGQNVTLVRWVIEAGRDATGLHSHDTHEQFTIVVTGTIETTVGDEVLTLAAGDVCRIGPLTLHGRTRALHGQDAVLIDVFEPCRDEYVAALRTQDARAQATA